MEISNVSLNLMFSEKHLVSIIFPVWLYFIQVHSSCHCLAGCSRPSFVTSAPPILWCSGLTGSLREGLVSLETSCLCSSPIFHLRSSACLPGPPRWSRDLPKEWQVVVGGICHPTARGILANREVHHTHWFKVKCLIYRVPPSARLYALCIKKASDLIWE